MYSYYILYIRKYVYMASFTRRYDSRNGEFASAIFVNLSSKRTIANPTSAYTAYKHLHSNMVAYSLSQT